MKDNLVFNPNQHLKNRYQLQRQLGNNAGRQTWLAQDLQSTEQVTVKLLAFSSQMQWDEFKLFEREAAVLKQLNHPRIPKYRDYFSLQQQIEVGVCWFGLVQDYIPGKSLQQLLDTGKRFTESQIRYIAKQVLEIITYLHGLNPPVLHRDIKPSNLILGDDKQVYLVDFGAVQNSAAVEGVTFTVVGTSGYAPLEQFWGQAVPASDLYALGATLIHLLTGITPADLPQRNLRIQFREQVSIKSQFISWIEALTEPDLDLRLSCASQALETLETGHSIRYPLETVHPPFSTRIKLQKSPRQLIVHFPGSRIGFFLDVSMFFFKIILFSASGLLLAALLGFIFFNGNIIFSLLRGSCFDYDCLVVIAIRFLLIYLTFYLCKRVLMYQKEMLQNIRKTKFSCLSKYEIIFNQELVLCDRLKITVQKTDIKGISKSDSINDIYLNMPTKKYYLAHRLTPHEVNWLVGEIEDWLTGC